MRILKFRRQPTIAFFAAVNHLILTDLLGNKTLLHGFKRSWFVICGFRSVLCFSVSRFVACDRNYDWRQRKTQLWRWLLKFRVRMFVKSAAKSQCSQRPLDQAGSMGSWLSVLVYFRPQLFKRWIEMVLFFLVTKVFQKGTVFWMSLCFSLTWDSVACSGRRQGFVVAWVCI